MSLILVAVMLYAASQARFRSVRQKNKLQMKRLERMISSYFEHGLLARADNRICGGLTLQSWVAK